MTRIEILQKIEFYYPYYASNLFSDGSLKEVLVQLQSMNEDELEQYYWDLEDAREDLESKHREG